MKLKIIDDFDLKQLEQYGFEYRDDVGIYGYTERKSMGITYIRVKSWNRIIEMRIYDEQDSKSICILYDLIQAGIVEKVDDKE